MNDESDVNLGMKGVR